MEGNSTAPNRLLQEPSPPVQHHTSLLVLNTPTLHQLPPLLSKKYEDGKNEKDENNIRNNNNDDDDDDSNDNNHTFSSSFTLSSIVSFILALLNGKVFRRSRYLFFGMVLVSFLLWGNEEEELLFPTTTDGRSRKKSISSSSDSLSSSSFSAAHILDNLYPNLRSLTDSRYTTINCDHPDTLKETVKLVHLSNELRRVSSVSGAAFSVGDYANIHPCVRLSRVRSQDWLQASAGGIGYIVLSSNNSIDRSKTQLETWGRDILPEMYYRSYGDYTNPSINMLTLPDIEGKSDYGQAQHRVLKGLQHAMKDPLWSSFDFIFVLGDDTYVNVPELRLFTAQWNPDVPAMFGWIWHKEVNMGGNSLRWATWPGGGSGMLFTRKAALMIADALYTSTCPFEGHDDVTFGYCCWRLGIPQVHSPFFDTYGLFLNFLQHPVAQGRAMMSVLSIHRVNIDQMHLLNNIFRAMHTAGDIPEDDPRYHDVVTTE